MEILLMGDLISVSRTARVKVFFPLNFVNIFVRYLVFYIDDVSKECCLCLVTNMFGGLKRTLTCIISLILLSSEFELLLLYRAFLLFQLLKYNISELRWCGPHPNQLPVKWLQMAEINSMPSNLLIVRTAKNVGTIFLFLGRIIGGLPWYSFLPQAVLE